MQEIEIRRSLEAEEVVSFQANAAVLPGVNGEPDRAVIALEMVAGLIESEEQGTQFAMSRVFSIEIRDAAGFVSQLDRARSLALALAEELG